MKQEQPQHIVDLSKPGSWSFIGSWFLFIVCVFSLLNALGEANAQNDKVVGGLFFCGAMLALIASILLFDRYKRETSD